MLYFFYGSDTDAARKAANALIENLQKEKPGAEVFRLDAEHASEAQLDELIGGQGLFSNRLIVQTAQLFENSELREIFLNKLASIARSPNIFISLEEKVDKKTLLLITEKAERAQLFESKKDGKKPDFSIFSLTDAFGKRDKRNLWVLLQKAIARGAVPEEIHGVLFWQLKSMLLASTTKTAGEAGVAPFVFTKAKSFLRNYTPEELREFSSKLVRLYHDAHRGRHDFAIALERFVLTL